MFLEQIYKLGDLKIIAALITSICKCATCANKTKTNSVQF